MASATPECTVPTMTSTLSRLISLLTFVVDAEVLDLAPAELAALLLHVEPEAAFDGVAQRGEGAGERQHQADLERRLALCLRTAKGGGGAQGEQGRA
jgi:hypothetical protein